MDRTLESIIQSAEGRARLWLPCRQVPRGKAKRKHKKRHSVNCERSYEERMKRLRAKQKQAAYWEQRRRYSAIVRAYWAGERDDLNGA